MSRKSKPGVKRGGQPKPPRPVPTSVTGAIVSELYWVPLDQIPDPHRVREYFTVYKRHIDHFTKHVSWHPIPVWREKDERPGMIGLPIADGEELFPCDDLVEDFGDPGPFDCFTRVPDPKHPSAAPGQDVFMAQALEALNDLYTSLLKAETGTGKTIVFLWCAAQLGLKTLIVVPSTVLMNQWIAQIQEHLGVDRKHIGKVQGEMCQYGPEKQFVVAMQKSLAMRDYQPEFYRAFGLVGVDEVHNTGAELMSQVQGLFHARHKTSLTATDKRGDGSDRVYHSYYGKPAFSVTMDGIDTEVLAVAYNAPMIHEKNRMKRIKALSSDHDRNEWLCRIVLHWYSNPANNILMVTELIDHAQLLHRFLMAGGIPENDIGLFLGAQDDGGGRDNTSPEYLKWCLETPRVVLSTYGMFKEGTDRPNLNRGIDCIPRGEMEQLLGRIRRRTPEKRDAVWVTPRDRNTPAFENAYFQRMRSLKGVSNVTVRKVDIDAVFRS